MIRTRILQFGLLATANAMVMTANTTKKCVDFEVSVPISATNNHYEMPRVDSSIDAVQWALNFSVHTAPLDRSTGTFLLETSFRINARLCVPTQKNNKTNILQIAVQGNGWDKR